MSIELVIDFLTLYPFLIFLINLNNPFTVAYVPFGMPKILTLYK